MQGPLRKVVQAILYEAVAIICVTPALAFFFKQSLTYSGMLAVLVAAIAMTWNMLFNTVFEAWESQQENRTRTLFRRILHAIGFEGGLVLILVPVVAYWLNISWWEAFVTDIALFAFFFFYAFAFQWCFDRIFDVPESAQANS